MEFCSMSLTWLDLTYLPEALQSHEASTISEIAYEKFVLNIWAKLQDQDHNSISSSLAVQVLTSFLNSELAELWCLFNRYTYCPKKLLCTLQNYIQRLNAVEAWGITCGSMIAPRSKCVTVLPYDCCGFGAQGWCDSNILLSDSFLKFAVSFLVIYIRKFFHVFHST